jgi:tRNA threonylcarbamoyladenosine biosynthesis protein TsaE
MDCLSESIKDTVDIAANFAKKLIPGDVVCLSGGLGAGKTVFTKGIALGLLAEGNVTSPTFSLINIYEGAVPVYHFDAYRINTLREAEDAGFLEYLYGNGVCVVEWAENIRGLIPDGAYWINIAASADDENQRIIKGLDI